MLDVNVLVTGVGGFIGSAVARALLAEGHAVRGLDNFMTGRREAVPSACDLVEGDLRDLAAVREATAGVEVVLHQAALRSVPRSVDDPVLTDEVNVRGTLHILMAARDAGVRRVVYASSSSVYGDVEADSLQEDTTPRPISPYGVSKLAGELYCRALRGSGGPTWVALRYFNVFGPGQPATSAYAAVFPAFVSALLEGRAPEVHWDGEQARDFTFIDDVVDANLRAAAAGPQADDVVLNIGDGRAKTVNVVLRAVSDAVGTWIEPSTTGRRAGDVRRTQANIEAAERVLGWKPRADWTAAVKATVEWFQPG